MDNHQPPAPESLPPQSAASPAAATSAPAEELIAIEHFAKVKFRVGQIVAAEAVVKSHKLLKLQVDLGPVLGTRQILSGIAKFYTPEMLLGKRIVVVANLKPATMMGLESQGMLLAASADDMSSLVLLDPGQNIPLGSFVR